MKGIAHFLSGVAVATCLPGVVGQAAQGSYLPALAGACALLPDTLDFKFARFFERADRVLAPASHAPGAADRLARELAAAYAAAAAGRAQTVRLRSERVAHDRWRRYSLRFDVPGQALEVRLGPLVTGGQVPLPGSEPADGFARVPLSVPLLYTYDAEMTTDVFAGPSLRFEPADGAVHVVFLPWHREQTHSLVLAVLVGVIAGFGFGPLAAWACGLGYATHVLEDQLGAMGSNLFWPLSRGRLAGLGLIRSGDALPNFLTVWLAVSVTIFNLDRFAAEPRLNALWFLGLFIALPVLVLGGAYAWQQRRVSVVAEVEKAREALDEGLGEAAT